MELIFFMEACRVMCFEYKTKTALIKHQNISITALKRSRLKISVISPPCALSGWRDWCHTYIVYCPLRLGYFSYSFSDSSWSTISFGQTWLLPWWSFLILLFLLKCGFECGIWSTWETSWFLTWTVSSEKDVIQRLLCTGQVQDGDWKNIACLMPLRKDRSGVRNRYLRTVGTGVKLGQLGKEGWPGMREENFFKKIFPSPSPEWDHSLCFAHLPISWTSGKTELLSYTFSWGLGWNSVWLCLSHFLLNHSSHGSCSSLCKILMGELFGFRNFSLGIPNAETIIQSHCSLSTS